jgi:hypothetical protein
MKKIVITLFALMLLASMANANVIGIFGDMGAATCSGPFIGMPTIYLFAELSDVAAITTVEFGVAGLPMNPTEAMQIITWNTTLAIGSMEDGIALAFNPPVEGPLAYLGMVMFVPMGGWTAGDDYKMEIIPSPSSGKLIVVNENFVEIDAMGWGYVWNCVVGGQYGDCSCSDEGGVATMDANWGSLKALY